MIRILNVDLKNTFCTSHNILYAVKDQYLLHMNIIVPPDNSDGVLYPLVMYVQGSGWRKQKMIKSMPYLMEFSKKGYVMAIVEYRYSEIASFPAQIKDMKTAIRFMMKNAKEYNADIDKMVIAGDSSGAHTAVMTEMTKDLQEFSDENLELGDLPIKAVIDLFGPTDLSKMGTPQDTRDHLSANSTEGKLFGGKNILEIQNLVQQANPIAYINKEKARAPYLIIHGTSDTIVNPSQSDMLYEALNNAGKQVEMIKITGAVHFGDPFWKPEVMEIMDSFIQSAICRV